MVNTGRYLATALLCFAVACGKPTPGTNNGASGNSPLKASVLQDAVTRVISPAQSDFVDRARALETATTALADGTGDLSTAQVAWREAMLAWQVVELFRFGPAGAMGVDAGGLDLRDDIYSWPTSNACRVDQELVAQSYTDAATLKAEAVNARGLDALEYLLFWTEPTNQCDANRSINGDGSWDALEPNEITSRRAAYAATAATLVRVAAEDLVAAWDDGFGSEFTDAASSTTFGSNQEALNAYSNALFYIELSVKDRKLAEPAGLLNCGSSLCPESREFRWTDENFPAVVANLDGFERAFTGGDGDGFDDLLANMGQEQLSNDVLTAVSEARDAAEAAPAMAEALQDDVEAVVTVHDEIKDITDVLKTQFVGVLDLELPMSAEGDND